MGGGRSWRFCGAPLSELVADLGMSAVSNAYVELGTPDRDEQFPLAAYCAGTASWCRFPQSETPERIFGDYPYFSSYSDTWVAHARESCWTTRERLRLGSDRARRLKSANTTISHREHLRPFAP